MLGTNCLKILSPVDTSRTSYAILVYLTRHRTSCRTASHVGHISTRTSCWWSPFYQTLSGLVQNHKNRCCFGTVFGTIFWSNFYFVFANFLDFFGMFHKLNPPPWSSDTNLSRKLVPMIIKTVFFKLSPMLSFSTKQPIQPAPIYKLYIQLGCFSNWYPIPPNSIRGLVLIMAIACLWASDDFLDRPFM